MFHTLEEVSALFTPAELAAIEAAAETDQFGGRRDALTATVAWANHVEKLAAADDQYRGFTVEDSGVRINAIPKPDRAWWWYRVPADGPVAVFLSGYDAEGNYVGQSEGDESKLITPPVGHDDSAIPGS